MPTLKLVNPEEDWSLPDAGAIRDEIKRLEEALKTLKDALRALAKAKPLLKNNTQPKKKKNPHIGAISSAPTGIRQAIREISDGLPKPFSAADVLTALEKRNFQFGDDPKSTIRDALYVLAKPGKGLKLVEKGKGGKPNLYERAK